MWSIFFFLFLRCVLCAAFPIIISPPVVVWLLPTQWDNRRCFKSGESSQLLLLLIRGTSMNISALSKDCCLYQISPRKSESKIYDKSYFWQLKALGVCRGYGGKVDIILIKLKLFSKTHLRISIIVPYYLKCKYCIFVAHPTVHVNMYSVLFNFQLVFILRFSQLLWMSYRIYLVSCTCLQYLTLKKHQNNN